MVNLNSFYEKEDNWKIVDDHLIVKTSDKEDGSNNENFYASIITLDDKEVFKNYIKVSVTLKKGAVISIPSIIRIKLCRMNGRDSINSLVINRLANKTTITTSEVNGKQTVIDNDSFDTDKIMETITNYIFSFSPLIEDEFVKKGLDIITPSLKEAIIKFANIWKCFNFDDYIKQQEYILNLERLEYQMRMRSSQAYIDYLKQLNKDPNQEKIKILNQKP